MSAMEPSKCAMRARITLAIIGISVGLIVFPVFTFHFKNVDAGVWGLVSGIFAAVTLAVHILYLRDFWKVFGYRLKFLMLLGCFTQLGGLCGFVTYLTIAIRENQGVTAFDRGFYVVVVWCFMTFKWGFALFYYSRSYKRIYDAENDPEKKIIVEQAMET